MVNVNKIGKDIIDKIDARKAEERDNVERLISIFEELLEAYLANYHSNDVSDAVQYNKIRREVIEKLLSPD